MLATISLVSLARRGEKKLKLSRTMSLKVPYQGMEQFLSSSPWCHRSLMDDVARDADELLGDEMEAGLMVENCQVGVFACLARGDEFALVDYRLYLPQDWAKDEHRCNKAKFPVEHRIYKPKWEQALEMVRQQGRSNKPILVTNCMDMG